MNRKTETETETETETKTETEDRLYTTDIERDRQRY